MTTNDAQRLRALEKKVTKIERDMALLVPTESLEEYSNSSDIKKAYKEAKKDFPND